MGASGRVPESLVYALVGIWTLACFSFFVLVPLPVGYQAGPVFQRPQELWPALFYVLAVAGYLRKGRWKRDPFEHWLVISILLCAGQSLYMSTSDKLYDAMYMASHGMKLLSYLSALTGLIVAMYHLFLMEESIVAERTEKLQGEILERKRAQEESLLLLRREQVTAAKVREERAFSEAVIQLLPAMVYIFNGGGRFLRWNTGLETTLGYSTWELTRLPVMEVVAEEDREHVGRKVRQVLEEGSAETEGRLVRKDGIKVPCYMTGVRITFDDKPCVLGAALDISVRKRAEEKVRLQATALESAANAIVITDSKGTIQWVNRAFTVLTGYSLEEVVGQNPRILRSGKHDEAFYKNLWDTIRAGKNWTGEIINRKKNGELYVDLMTIAPVRSAGGEITNFVAIKQDATERKRMEADMMRAKELAESANRAKSEFLANMSHELRTPLNGMLGMTELALDTELTAEQREFLSMAKASADSLLGLIDDILDFSKIEAGKLKFESIEFDLRGSLETTLKTLAPRAHEKGLELNFQIGPEAPEIVVGDPSRLRQVLVNLVGNAIKFTEQGEVTVEVAVDGAEAGDTLLRFSVTDTGIGIPVDRQERIFGAFVQGDGSTTRRHGGSGLGLTVSRRLVEMFGGRLWLQSEAGKGSTFHFTARFGLGRPREGVVPLAAAKLEGMSALVVDDNRTNRRILEQLLTSWRLKPILAEEARNALRLLKQAAEAGTPYALVLVDSIMPEVDGFTLVQQIREDPQLATATIMMLTSGGRHGDAARCRELGVAAYLTKPIGQGELLNAILQVMGTRPATAEQPARLVTRHSVRERIKGLRILLAEDNLVNRTLAVRLLEKHGHAVEVATDGGEALRKYQAGRFDLILMDVQMPEVDGFEATASIREMETTTGTHVPIMAMTAHALTGDRERCLAAGMDGYISKPFQVEELLKEMESIGDVLAGVAERNHARG
jgi:PAS domain S-box-containing protein